MLSRLFRWVHERFILPKKPLDREIYYVERSLARHQAIADEVKAAFYANGSTCCVHCYGGSEYSALLAKIERVERQLQRLYERRATSQNAEVSE